MKRLIGVLVVLVILAAGLSVADVWVRHRVQGVIASHIESQFPGSHATVAISSFPFVGRLAVSGTVPKLTADVTGIKENGLTFSDIDLTVTNLKVDKSQLTSGKVVLRSISSGTVQADLTQSSLDSLIGQPVTLGSGTAELAGVVFHPTVSVNGTTITLGIGALPPVQVPVSSLGLLPCVGDAVVVPGALQLSCRLTSLPPALAGYSASF